MRSSLTISLLLACGSTSPGTTDANGSAQPDARANSVDDVTCQTHTFTVTASDGSKTITDTRFALIAGIDPTGYYATETCDAVVTVNGVPQTNQGIDPPCPSGSTCADSGAVFPVFTHICSFVTIGSFIDDKLFVSCGNKSTNINAAGTTTSTIDTSYGAIRVHH